jgi:hypothetical protein
VNQAQFQLFAGTESVWLAAEWDQCLYALNALTELPAETLMQEISFAIALTQTGTGIPKSAF